MQNTRWMQERVYKVEIQDVMPNAQEYLKCRMPDRKRIQRENARESNALSPSSVYYYLSHRSINIYIAAARVLNRPIAFSLVHRPNNAPSLPSFFEDRRMAHPLIHKLASFFQEKNPPAFFTHKLFRFSIIAVLAFLQVFTPGMANTGVLYDVAVTSFLLYVLVYATVEASSSSSSSRLPRCATNSLRWCVFFASNLSFAATASLLFRDSVRLLVFVALFFFINISAFALPLWVYETPIESRWGWRRCKQFFINIWEGLAGSSAQQASQVLPLFHRR